MPEVLQKNRIHEDNSKRRREHDERYGWSQMGGVKRGGDWGGDSLSYLVMFIVLKTDPGRGRTVVPCRPERIQVPAHSQGIGAFQISSRHTLSKEAHVCVHVHVRVYSERVCVTWCICTHAIHRWVIHRWVIQRWVIHRWVIHRWVIHRWVIHRWVIHRWVIHRWVIQRWVIHRWVIHRWVIHRWVHCYVGMLKKIIHNNYKRWPCECRPH